MVARKVSKKRTVLRTAARVVPPKDQVWAAIRSFGSFTILDIERNTDAKEEMIRKYVAGLTLAGYLVKHTLENSKGRFPAYTWVLINDVGVEAPQVTKDGKEITRGRGREQLWRTMGMLRDFDPRDLAFNSSTKDNPVTVGEAHRYLKYMLMAGYVVVVQKGSLKSTRYQMVPGRKTGPKAPRVSRIVHVFDPNRGELMYPPQGGAS